MTFRIPVLDPTNPKQTFPPPQTALADPNGLLAVGGCLSVTRLLNAYKLGIFPWFNPGEPILWWSPNPRLVLFPDQLIISRSLRKTLRKNDFTVTYDKAFNQVMAACALPRQCSTGTWITDNIKSAYEQLHEIGVAHSVETWSDGELVGGLYGVSIGQVFFGESMFHFKTDASKVAFATLISQLKQWDYQLVDCQVHTEHLSSLGAHEIDRAEFNQLLKRFCNQPTSPHAWSNS